MAKLNRSNWEHGVTGLIVQHVFVAAGAIGALVSGMRLPLGLYWGALAGLIGAVAFYLGREHAQREYKIGNPSDLVGYEAFDFHNWSQDALYDLLAPIYATSGALSLYLILVLATGGFK